MSDIADMIAKARAAKGIDVHATLASTLKPELTPEMRQAVARTVAEDRERKAKEQAEAALAMTLRQFDNAWGYPARAVQFVQRNPEPQYPGMPGIVRAVAEHLRAGRWVVMLGRYGPGKTTCATAACRMLAAERVTSRYYKAADLIDCYRHDCYRDGQEWSAWIKRLNSTARVLVLDEIETLRETDDERHTLARILDARYEALRPCVVVSNLAPADFEQQVGGRIADRLAQVGEIVKFLNPSFRRAGGAA